MKIISLELLVNQLCFFLLCFTTFLSWGKVVFSQIKVLHVVNNGNFIICNILLLIILFERWVVSAHVPLSNLYESSMFLAWSITILYLFLQQTIKSNWLGAIIAPSALFIEGFATFGLPLEMQQSTNLVPALQSNWLMMHVSMMLFSYGLLLFGCLLSVTLLITAFDTQSKSNIYNINMHPYHKMTNEYLEREFFSIRQNKVVDQLDYWSYRAIGIGFPLLTVGILSGAVWANEAWGAYWSWDPKETWAFITWLIFAIYLHTRMIQGWSKQKTAVVASLGLFVVWACYLGVNLLGKGLHSYGWLS